ncbi:MAG: hypothetical protein JO281_14040 [Pseudonocardiales bacterium]|nr:hypothetical protein [Pseudonocardiales bacterium]
MSKEVLKDVERFGSRANLGRYGLPFTGVDREAKMTIAHAQFTCRAATVVQAIENSARPG